MIGVEGEVKYKVNAVFNVFPYNPVEIDKSNLHFKQLRNGREKTVDAYVSLKKPVIKKVTESSNNAIDVFLEEWNSGAAGYDVVASKSLEKLKKREYCLSSLGNENVGLGYCSFQNVEKGNYYFALRLYEYVNGEKIHSEWSEPVKLAKTSRLPKKAVIKSVKIKGSTVQVTVKRDFHTKSGNPKAFGEWGMWSKRVCVK